jgi:hypothetical protein
MTDNITKMADSKYKLGKEAAREQLNTLYEYYEIDFDELPEELGKALRATDLKLLKSVRLGRVEISLDENSAIKVVQNIRHGEPLIYKEIDGKAKVAMGGKDEKDHYGKAYALMGSLCGLGESAITQLKSHDLSVVECLGTVFLQA